MISPRQLSAAVREAVETAERAGSLVPLATSIHVIHAGGIDFTVRVADDWRKKPAAGGASPGAGGNPFLPPFEPGLHVCDLSTTHTVLLNKFPVLDEHLLIVTREYASQVGSLTDADFAAALHMLHAGDGLVFYNGGPEAGASQPHRHLQWAPLPLGPVGERLAVRPWLTSALLEDGIGHNPDLPFPHAVARMPSAWWSRQPDDHGAALRRLYLRLWAHLGEDATGSVQPGPFNLLSTREWVWLVPRTRDGVEGLSVNALGFAGCLLAGDAQRLAHLRRIGPLDLLTAVCPGSRGGIPA